jgi:hypothetical protein
MRKNGENQRLEAPCSQDRNFAYLIKKKNLREIVFEKYIYI